MYVNACACMYVFMYVCMLACLMYVCTGMHVCLHVCIFIYICMHACVHVCISIVFCVCCSGLPLQPLLAGDDDMSSVGELATVRTTDSGGSVVGAPMLTS